MIHAVVFDLDGVLIDSEQLWDQARREVVAQQGGHWRDGATGAMQGMSSPEWSAYMRDNLCLTIPESQIVNLVVDNLLQRYRQHLPLLPGAIPAVERVGKRWPLGLASSANRVIIDAVLGIAGLTRWFSATVSSEEVERGKPWPDVYLEATRRLGELPDRCAAIEDSTNGIRSAAAAGLHVVVIPNRQYPPSAELLSRADMVLPNLDELAVEKLEGL